MRYKLVLFFAALSFWYVLNECNLSYANSINKTYYDVINFNPDVRGYTNQIYHMLDGHGFTFDPVDNPEMAVRRTPGYPFFYGVHYLLSNDEAGSFWAIRYTQLFLFALSCVLLGMSVFNYTNKRRWAEVTAWMYAFSPFVPMYAYFVVTEALVPFMVVLVLFLASLYHKEKAYKYLYLVGVALGALFLTRPVVGVMLPAIFLSFVQFKKLFQKTYFKKVFVEGLIYGLGFATFVGPWVVRNYVITDGDIVLAETFYHEAPMNFGRGHFYFRTLTSAWTNSGSGKTEILADKFRTYADKDLPDEVNKTIQDYLESHPPYIYDVISRNEFESLLYGLYDCAVDMKHYKTMNPSHNREYWVNQPCQFENKKKAVALTKQFKEKAGLHYYLITPLTTLFKFCVQSNTQHIISLNPKGRNFTLWQKGVKAFCLLLNLCLFFSVFFFLFTKTESNLKILFVFFLLTTVLFFTWGIRHTENRYMIPLVPIGHTALAYFVANLWDWWDNRKVKIK